MSGSGAPARARPAGVRRLGAAAIGAGLGVAVAAGAGAHPRWLLLAAAVIVGLTQQALP